jgi:hypothetical protein
MILSTEKIPHDRVVVQDIAVQGVLMRRGMETPEKVTERDTASWSTEEISLNWGDVKTFLKKQAQGHKVFKLLGGFHPTDPLPGGTNINLKKNGN